MTTLTPPPSRTLRSLLRRRRSKSPPSPPAPIPTQQEYRRRFIASPTRTLLAASVPHTLHPMLMNGDCGFAAIARGITLAHQHEQQSADAAAPPPPPPPSLSLARLQAALKTRGKADEQGMAAKDVRKAMADEVRGDVEGYVERSAGLVSAERLNALVANVVRPGLAGFWLGSEAGVLEFVILARALDIAVALYCFDVKSQRVRRFESASAEKPRFEVRLLFTGPAASGHFDLLMPVPEGGEVAGEVPPPAQPPKGKVEERVGEGGDSGCVSESMTESEGESGSGGGSGSGSGSESAREQVPSRRVSSQHVMSSPPLERLHGAALSLPQPCSVAAGTPPEGSADSGGPGAQRVVSAGSGDS